MRRASSNVSSCCWRPSIRFAEHAEPALLLAEIDEAVADKDAFQYVLERLAPARDKPDVGELLSALLQLADATAPLATAMAQRFGPLVEDRLRARKRSAGHYDYEDMLALVAEALRGPQGGDMAAALRARFRLAIIDEFQDTDPVQWEIFRTIFLDGPRTTARMSSAIPSSRSTVSAARMCNTYTGRLPRHRSGAALSWRSTATSVRRARSSRRSTRSSTRTRPSPSFRRVRATRTPSRAGGNVRGATRRTAAAVAVAREGGERGRSCPCASCVRRWRARSPTRSQGCSRRRTRRRRTRCSCSRAFARNRRRCRRAGRARRAGRGVRPGGTLRDRRGARGPRSAARAAIHTTPANACAPWLTPFFALPITELPAAAAGLDQPLRDRLSAWHAAAQSHDLADLFGRILADSGVVRRELAAGDSLRRLTNYQQLFEMLAAEAGRAAPASGSWRAGCGAVARLIAAAPAKRGTSNASRAIATRSRS